MKDIGERHWKEVAQRVPGRSHVQCLQRWKKVDLRLAWVVWLGADARLSLLVGRCFVLVSGRGSGVKRKTRSFYRRWLQGNLAGRR